MPMDLRGLPAPEPFERIMEALLDAVPSSQVSAILPHMPHPLLRILERDGYRYETESLPQGAVKIVITQNV